MFALILFGTLNLPQYNIGYKIPLTPKESPVPTAKPSPTMEPYSPFIEETDEDDPANIADDGMQE